MKKVAIPVGVILALTLIARNTNRYMGEGRHVVSIKSAVPANPTTETAWKDKTPQLKVTFVNKDGESFSAWYNLMGYKEFSKLTPAEQKSGKFVSMGDEGYAVVKATGKRVEDSEKTESAQNILCRLAYDAGVDEGTEFTEKDLIGKAVGIIIGGNDRGNPRVKGTFMPDEAAIEAAGIEQTA